VRTQIHTQGAKPTPLEQLFGGSAAESKARRAPSARAVSFSEKSLHPVRVKPFEQFARTVLTLPLLKADLPYACSVAFR